MASKTRREFMVGAAATAALAASVPLARAQSTVTLKYSAWLPLTHGTNQDVLIPWFKQIEEVTQGRVKVEILPKVVGTAANQYDVIRDGLADISYIAVPYTPGRFPLAEMSDLPLISGEGAANGIAFERTYMKHLAPLNEFGPIKVMSIFCITPVHLFTVKKPIHSFADLNGMKIRSIIRGASFLLEKAGAIPVQKNNTEGYELMSAGAVDGQVNQAEGLVLFKTMEFTKHGTLIPGGLGGATNLVAVNLDTWNRISKEDQAAIEGITTGKLAKAMGERWGQGESAAVETLRAQGVELHTADEKFVAELREAAQPLYQQWFEAARAKGVADPEMVLDEYIREIAAAGG